MSPPPRPPGAGSGDERLAVVLLDHGSRRPEANRQLEELARQLAARRPDASWRTAHLEIATPDLQQAIDDCARSGATRVVVHPFFLLAGRHTTHDVPERIAAARERHPGLEIVQSDPVGASELLLDAVLEQIGRASSRRSSGQAG